MEKHLELSDTEFEQKFKARDLDPEDFSHEAHLRLAWIHINRYGLKKAEENIQAQLKNFVESAGARDKYHTTLTLAAIKAVYHFMKKSRSEDFTGFIKEFPRLKHNFKELISCHYGFDVYHSEPAKRRFLEPDLLPFD